MPVFNTVLDRAVVEFSSENSLRKGTLQDLIRLWNAREGRQCDLALLDTAGEDGKMQHEFVILSRKSVDTKG